MVISSTLVFSYTKVMLLAILLFHRSEISCHDLYYYYYQLYYDDDDVYGYFVCEMKSPRTVRVTQSSVIILGSQLFKDRGEETSVRSLAELGNALGIGWEAAG